MNLSSPRLKHKPNFTFEVIYILWEDGGMVGLKDARAHTTNPDYLCTDYD